MLGVPNLLEKMTLIGGIQFMKAIENINQKNYSVLENVVMNIPTTVRRKNLTTRGF